MNFIYSCGKLVPVNEYNCSCNWKTVVLCLCSGIILIEIFKYRERELVRREVRESLEVLKSELNKDLKAINSKLDKIETALRTTSTISTDTSDLTQIESPPHETLHPILELTPKKQPLTLPKLPHYKATTDISGKIIREHQDVKH